MQKMKPQSLGGIQSHNRREHESKTNTDIDYSRTNKNIELPSLSNGMTYEKAFKERLNEVGYKHKVRSNAVVCGSFIVSASPTWFDGKSEVEHFRYFQDVSDFLKQKYGEKNVLYSTVHYDEATPHMHIGIVPITNDGRLSARDVFVKSDFVKLQESLNKFLREKGYELEKGEKTANTKHLEPAELKRETLFKLDNELQEKQTKIDKLDKRIDKAKKEIPLVEIPVIHFRDERVKEKKSLLGKRTVEIPSELFENVKKGLGVAETLRNQNNALERKIEQISGDLRRARHRISEQNTEIVELKSENEKLGRMIELWRKFVNWIIDRFAPGIDIDKQIQSFNQEQVQEQREVRERKSQSRRYDGWSR